MRKVAVLTGCLVLCMAAVSLAGGYDKLPAGMKGFSGMVRGEVVAKVEKGFVLRVGKILKLWKGNKAENPESAIGKKLLVSPRWQKGERGKWHPVELHVKFIRRLEVGQEITIEVRHVEGNALQILELSGEQREWAAGAGDKGEKEDGKAGKIEAGKPAYEPRDHRAWRSKGRIVGKVRNAPESAKVEALNARKRVVKSVKLKKGQEGYELEWLSPGTYTLRVSAKGYETLTVKGLKVKKGHDLFVNIEFSRPGAKHEREEKEKHREEKERPKAEKHVVDKPKNWPEEGGILGVVTSIGSTTISVKVLKASKGAREMVGETVTFYANWIKNKESKWVPDPEEVALIKSCELEQKVEIHFYFEEHYRIKKLEKE